MRLIDKNNVLKAVKTLSIEFDAETVQRCIEIVSNQPIVDAVPVRHGKWIHDGYDHPHGVDWMHCSECGRRYVYCPAAMTNYCPNCGARMDEE